VPEQFPAAKRIEDVRRTLHATAWPEKSVSGADRNNAGCRRGQGPDDAPGCRSRRGLQDRSGYEHILRQGARRSLRGNDRVHSEAPGCGERSYRFQTALPNEAATRFEQPNRHRQNCLGATSGWPWQRQATPPPVQKLAKDLPSMSPRAGDGGRFQARRRYGGHRGFRRDPCKDRLPKRPNSTSPRPRTTPKIAPAER